jgi:NADPH:quinone reductase-like Zn-dependent oxidoreductase
VKAAFVPRYGGPEVVELRELPLPVPGPGALRIRVLACAVTTGDYRVRSGVLPRGFGALRGLALGFAGPRQAVLGTDAAGVVEAVIAGVQSFAVGDPVVAFPGAAMGGHAEYLVMPERGCVARKPPNLTFEEAAALPFGAMTALDFFARARLAAGEHVLINGASGNVGSMAVQLAKQRGARVTAVCSGANAALVRQLGADEVIDHQRVDFGTQAARYDVIVDTVGNAPYARVKHVLAPGGRLLVVLGDLSALLAAPFTGRLHGHRVIAGPAAEKPADLWQLVTLAAEGKLVPVIDQRFPFARIADAYRVVDAGKKRGSVLLTLEPPSSP